MNLSIVRKDKAPLSALVPPPLKPLWLSLTISVIGPSISLAGDPFIEQINPIGLDLAATDVAGVRDHLWQLGGVSLARKSNGHNFDKFFTRTRFEDSRYLTFRYDPQGQVVSFKRVYHPLKAKVRNQSRRVQTRDIAQKLAQTLGPATDRRYKTWAGMPGYSVYIWEDETLKIQIDRQGSDPMGDVYILYTLKARDPNQVDPTLALRQAQQ